MVRSFNLFSYSVVARYSSHANTPTASLKPSRELFLLLFVEPDRFSRQTDVFNIEISHFSDPIVSNRPFE